LPTIREDEVLYFYHTVTKNTIFDLEVNYFLTGFVIQFNSGAANFLFIKFYINCVLLPTIREDEVLYFYHTVTKSTKFDLEINYFFTGFVVQFNWGQQIFS
jgi:hypothetical protein